MNLFTPKECAANYTAAGTAKTRMPLVKMFLLAVLAGFFIAMGGRKHSDQFMTWSS